MYTVENNVANVITLIAVKNLLPFRYIYMPVRKGTRFHLIDSMDCWSLLFLRNSVVLSLR
jgi:hypothetical protein